VDYVVDPKKKKVVDELLKAAKNNENVLLATDPDREGEAISWHVKWLMENAKGKDKIESKKISRVTFHEITKDAIKEALTHPREVDMALVDAQQGRRVLDRVVGYSLSPVLWKKVRRGLSAGRVQSVAVRLVCEREREIGKFKQETFFDVKAELKEKKEKFETELIKVDGKNIYKTQKIKLFDGEYSFTSSVLINKKEVEKFIASLEKKFVVENIKGRETSRLPLPAFTTSKLQQTAARKFGWSGKQTMSVAQKLYEKGLISYHRTDSVYLSDKAIGEFRNLSSAR